MKISFKKIAAKFRSFMLFGGLTRENYRSIRRRINDENRRSTNIFTLLGAFAFLITGILSSFMKQGASSTFYYVAVAVLLLMFVVNFAFCKKYPGISDAFAIIFSILVLAAGILVAYFSPNERTTLLLPLFGLVSLVFCYRPIYLVAILTVGEIAYLLLMRTVQSGDLYTVNMVNTLIFYVIGLIGGAYMLSFKHRKYEADIQNQLLLERDVLTGLYNRYSIHKAFEKIDEEKTPMTLFSLDVNGLKKINDTKGHLAGDELIIGAATCIKDVFGKYGNVYRTGGDEFAVIVFSYIDEEKIRADLLQRAKAWKGTKAKTVSISMGYAKIDFSKENAVDEVIHLADVEMYKEKQKYHKEHDE